MITKKMLEGLFGMPLLELIAKASAIHCKFHDRNKVQLCTLISVKTGGCPEDCKYCAQSSRYQSPLKATPIMKLEDVLEIARNAKNRGSSRICLGAAWREVRDNTQFEEVLKMVKEISAMGLEVCCTLGMLNGSQAKRLKEEGLYAYNHNVDTSANYYPEITTTRTYEDRLNTLEHGPKCGD